jgi:hypothetical protein
MAITVFQEERPFSNKKTIAEISTGTAYSNPVIMPISLDLTENSEGNIFETVIYLRNNELDKYYRNVVVSLVKSTGDGTHSGHMDMSFRYNSETKTYLAGMEKYLDIKTTMSEEDGSPAPFLISYPDDTIPIVTYKVNSDPILGTLSHSSTTVTDITTIGLEVGMLVVSDYLAANTKITEVNANTIVLNKKPTSTRTNEPLTFYADADDTISAKISFGYNPLSPVEWAKMESVLIIPYLGTLHNGNTSYIPVRIRITFKNNTHITTIRTYSLDVSYEDV